MEKIIKNIEEKSEEEYKKIINEEDEDQLNEKDLEKLEKLIKEENTEQKYILTYIKLISKLRQMKW